MRTPPVKAQWRKKMFKIYEWNFSSTAELAVGALLVLTMVIVAFV